MRYTGPSRAVVAVVKARNNGMCLRCGRCPGVHVHHRQPRGRGGTSRPEANQPDNLAYLCWACHEHIENNRSEAYAFGWLVRHGLDEPYQVPLTDLAGRMFFLSEEGDVIMLAAAGQPPF